LYPKVLHCADCGLDVTTRYAGNEFADLDADDLHLLRIFVVCEGRIRDMESALGVSYPTVKSRLAALRGRLGHAADAMKTATDSGKAASPESASAPSGANGESGGDVAAASTPELTAREILDRLADGSTTYDEALSRIRALKNRS
jgi:hypothetical protein